MTTHAVRRHRKYRWRRVGRMLLDLLPWLA